MGSRLARELVVPILVSVLTATASGCGPSSVTSIGIEDWCVTMETALRDRHVRCGCPGGALTDEAIEARCAALDAASLLALYDADAIGWNGAIATAQLRATESCEERPDAFLDDPVIGDVAPGSPCRVFADVWGHPDDCAHGARCLVPLGGGEPTCVELVGEGESCEAPRACERGLLCGDDRLCAPVPPTPAGARARGEACDDSAQCADANCIGGTCAAPACSPV